jgi:hypothetical protein
LPSLDVAALIQDYDKFLEKEEKEAAKGATGSITGWGSFIAVGLLSTAVFAMNKMRK